MIALDPRPHALGSPGLRRGPERASLGSYLTPSAFWAPEFVVHSHWLEHAPFAFWLVEVLRPSTIVELGTYGGFSHFAFCQAVKALGLKTQCFAVDTWKGDEHVGHYGEELFAEVRAYNQGHYASFSHLIRSTFDEALSNFGAGSIDLLHIDGRHSYENVRHDFETWQPKLSSLSMVLFHDTNVYMEGFGVAQFWSEIRGNYPSFEFLHGHGLGVLGYGSSLPKELSAFFSSTADPGHADEVRAAYARLGGCVSARYSFDVQQRELEECRREIEAQSSAREHENQIYRKGLQRQVARLAKREKQLNRLRDKLERERAKLARFESSTGRRISAPLRAVFRVLRPRSRHKSKSTRLMD